jgi:phosphatidylglycerophosphatase A
VASEARRILGGKDPSPIVCDEIMGFGVAAYLLPFSLFNAILGGAGIVLDDIVAGIYANVATQVLIRLVQG